MNEKFLKLKILNYSIYLYFWSHDSHHDWPFKYLNFEPNVGVHFWLTPHVLACIYNLHVTEIGKKNFSEIQFLVGYKFHLLGARHTTIFEESSWKLEISCKTYRTINWQEKVIIQWTKKILERFLRFIQQPMDGFFSSKDIKNHKKLYIFLITKTFINFQTAENAMRREKPYFITNSPKLKGCAIQSAFAT